MGVRHALSGTWWPQPLDIPAATLAKSGFYCFHLLLYIIFTLIERCSKTPCRHNDVRRFLKGRTSMRLSSNITSF